MVEVAGGRCPWEGSGPECGWASVLGVAGGNYRRKRSGAGPPVREHPHSWALAGTARQVAPPSVWTLLGGSQANLATKRQQEGGLGQS